MYCRYCGYKLPDNTNFCTECGKVTDNSKIEEDKKREDVTSRPYEAMSGNDNVKSEDPFKKEKQALGGRILTLAIVGLILSSTLYGSIVGLVISIIALSKVKKYTKAFGFTEGRATVGKGLGIAALALNVLSFISMLWSIISFILELIEPGSSGGGGTGIPM